MLAVVVFATGTVAVMELLQRAQAGATDGENVLIATHLAQRRFEELRNSAYANLANEAEARVTSPSGFNRFCRQLNVATAFNNASIVQLDVTVSWDPPDCTTSTSNPHVSLSTYRSNI